MQIEDRVLPLFDRRKRFTPHRLKMSLKRFGFKSWYAFLPGKGIFY